MPQGKEIGVVLSKKNSGEADHICSIYTKNSGKEKFIFRGLKKSTKRPRTASEPGSILSIIYYGRDERINTISEFDILSNNSAIRKNSEKIFSLYFILELVDLTTGLSDPNSKIFNLLSIGIDTLYNSQNPKHFIIFFTIKYLMLQGVLPDLSRCVWCGNNDAKALLIDNDKLRVSCLLCADLSSALVKSKGTEFMNECVKNKFNKIECENYSEEDINPVLAIIIRYINGYFNIKLKTEAFLM
ncbi:MAG: DNA repair protein RecO [Leptospirales bacterium]|nr:DNA repair protein RecO [Leptospirales bacterium]